MTKIIYFGSPAFSAQILESLIQNQNFDIVAAVTNPDTLQGRNKLLTPTPVALLAQKHHLPVFKPARLDAANLTHLKLLKPDLFLVASYGKIIPVSWLELPRLATLNLHFSLLPQYRGALCISQAIKNQNDSTGVTLMQMDELMDHGPIIAQTKQKISLDDDCQSLTAKLTRVAIGLLKTKLPLYLAGKIKARPQNHAQADYTPSIKDHNHASAFISFKQIQAGLNGQKAGPTHALIRSLNPQPGAWTKIKDLKLKIIKTSLLKRNQKQILVPETVQLPGRSPISWNSFLSGHPQSLP